jgi:hypothetical protein
VKRRCQRTLEPVHEHDEGDVVQPEHAVHHDGVAASPSLFVVGEIALVKTPNHYIYDIVSHIQDGI